MTSEIRVNKIENRSGLGTVTFADTGVDLAGIVTATTFSGSGASLTGLPAAQLSGTLPAISGANLTNLAAANLTGTIADARFPATLPAVSAASLTQIPAANIVGVCTSGLTKTGGFGKLINYSSLTKTDMSSASCDQGAMTGDMISLSYAAASSSNKLLFLNSITCGGQTGMYINFFVGGAQSVSGIRGDQHGSNAAWQRVAAGNYGYGDSSVISIPHNFLLSSPSTSSTDYSYRLSHANTGTHTLWINQGLNYGNLNYQASGTSTIAILEFGP